MQGYVISETDNRHRIDDFILIDIGIAKTVVKSSLPQGFLGPLESFERDPGIGLVIWIPTFGNSRQHIDSSIWIILSLARRLVDKLPRFGSLSTTPTPKTRLWKASAPCSPRYAAKVLAPLVLFVDEDHFTNRSVSLRTIA